MSSRHVLVTGTSTGIGRACAVRLAGEGFHVWATVRTDADAAGVAAAGTATPGGIRPVLLDVTDGAAITEAASVVGRVVGDAGLCGLVNNAGICVVGPAEFVSLDDWRRQFDVNLFGAIAVTQAMLPLLRRRVGSAGPGSARVVNISSITGEVATPLFAAYSASKFALSAFSDALRLELKGDGIGVGTIVPGTIRSEIWRKEKQCVDAIGPDARRHYGRLIETVAAYVFRCADGAIPADRVAAAVSHCLTSRRPRIRYRVGWEARVGSRAKRWIPDRVFDFLMARTLGLPRGPEGPVVDAFFVRSNTPATINGRSGDAGGAARVA